MSRSPAIASGLVLLLLAPGALAAAPARSDYPEDLRSLVPDWIASLEALVTPQDREQVWFSEAEGFLVKAKEAQAGGSVRIVLFHLETFHELLLTNRLMDEGKALGTDAEAKSLVLQRTRALKAEMEREWADYRARLHTFDGELRSLVTVEKALYSADLALSGVIGSTEFDHFAREFPKQPGFPDAYVYALVRATATPRLAIGWADDILTAAVQAEGLPPRVNEDAWNNATAASLAYGFAEGDAPDYLEIYEEFARPARENGEALLALVVLVAEQRAARAHDMQTLFGDARSRGLDVVRDAARGMGKQLNATTVDTPRAYGLTGVFTSDAIERARLTQDYVAREQADLGVVIGAWSALEHQGYMTTALSAVSPVVPPTPENNAPGAGLLALVGVALVAAALARRRA